jgi:hypothetical protein
MEHYHILSDLIVTDTLAASATFIVRTLQDIP